MRNVIYRNENEREFEEVGQVTPYRRRNRPVEREPVKTARLDEEELVLHLKKGELLDSHVLLPHAEVNAIVYQAVNQFVEKYSGETMQLTIMADFVSEPVQDIFREAYRSHYEDEYQKISRYLKRRYLRVALLLLVSAVAFWSSGFLSGWVTMPAYLIAILGQISVFCVWEIGYTYFSRVDAKEEQNRIARARDAEIRFHCRK